MKSPAVPNQAFQCGVVMEKGILALSFLAVGGLIYLVFNPLRPLFDPIPDYLGRIGLIAGLLALLLAARGSERLRSYRPVIQGLLIMALAVSLDRIFSIYLPVYMHISDTRAAGIAVQKLNEGFIVVSVVLAFTILSGRSLGSIYVQKGNLRSGLMIGGTAFLVCAAGSIFMADFLFKGQGITLERITGWLPWLVIFVLANASQEELLSRGLFLRRLEPFFGKFTSNFLIMIVFTLLHSGTNYASNNLIFVIGLILLALAWGYVMQRTNSIWGSILFHAGVDIPIMLGIFSNLE